MRRDIWQTIPENPSEWIKDNEAEELDRIEYYNDELRRIINQIWRMKKLPDNICTVDDEKIFIEVMRGKYIYPDYAELVEEPSTDDFESGSYGDCLKTERKADLLLLGAFTWKGMCIAKVPHHKSHALKGWEVCIDSEYFPSAGLGLLWRGWDGWQTTPRYDEFTFMPFHKYDSQLLHDFLAEVEIELDYREPLGKFQKYAFRDKNPYNCHPDNIIAIEKRGRKMYCAQCGEETTKDESKVIRDHGQKLRYCISCLSR